MLIKLTVRNENEKNEKGGGKGREGKGREGHDKKKMNLGNGVREYRSVIWKDLKTHQLLSLEKIILYFHLRPQAVVYTF
tara:strand:- start:306 stop:542 length:237 start_codon:yes stop_codon:yes gene_type:complete